MNTTHQHNDDLSFKKSLVGLLASQKGLRSKVKKVSNKLNLLSKYSIEANFHSICMDEINPILFKNIRSNSYLFLKECYDEIL